MITRRELHKTLVAAVTTFASAEALEWLRPETILAIGSQETAPNPISAVSLLREPLDQSSNLEIVLLRVTLTPHAQSEPHRHSGPVIVYLLEGSVENQVEPGLLKTYTQGEFFYEPTMHVHRTFRNPSATQRATLLLFQVGETGKKFTIPDTEL